MAMNQVENLGHFKPLFTRSVPHVLEKIFISLDIDSFLSCRRVCRELNQLLSSPAYQRQMKKMLARVIITIGRLLPAEICHIIEGYIIRDSQYMQQLVVVNKRTRLGMMGNLTQDMIG